MRKKLYEVGKINMVLQYTREPILYTADVDIYAPCAMGATINDATIDNRLYYRWSSKQPLANEDIHGAKLQERGSLICARF
jgi:leucine dehydrogenase